MPRDTKSALLDLAEKAVRARGFDAFSYADLANAIGIKKASIHYHFPAKADLAAALMDRYHAEMVNALVEIGEKYKNAAQRLRATIEVYRNALNGGETLCLCISFTTTRESLSPEVKEKTQKFRAMMVEWLESIFKRAAKDGSIVQTGDPHQEAWATLALLEGAHLAARASENLTDFDLAVRLLERRC